MGLETHQLPGSELSGNQRAWDTLAATVARDRLLVSANQVHRARLLAAGQPHTAAWVQAVPVPSLGLHLDNETVRIAVALRLGAPICEPHRCRACARPVTSLGIHGLSCSKSAGRHSRHAHLNDVIRRSLSSAGFPSVLEPVSLDRGDGRRPDGLTVFPFREGKSLTWDVTCVDTFAECALVRSSLEPGAAASQAEARKRQRYADISQRYIFEPVALETSGVYGPAAAAFIKELGRKISAQTGERRETAWLRQRLSIAIARGNAASVLATAPSASVENAYRIRSRAPVLNDTRSDETASPAPTQQGRSPPLPLPLPVMASLPERPPSPREEPAVDRRTVEPSRDPLDDPVLARYLLPRDGSTLPCPSESSVAPRHTVDRLADYAALLSEMRRDARKYGEA